MISEDFPKNVVTVFEEELNMTVIQGSTWLAICSLLVFHVWTASEHAIGQPAVLHVMDSWRTKNGAFPHTDKKKESLTRAMGNRPLLMSNALSGMSDSPTACLLETSETISRIQKSLFRSERLRLVADLIDGTQFDCAGAEWILNALPFETEREIAAGWVRGRNENCLQPTANH